MILGILAGVYSQFVVPVYRAEVLVLPVDWERAGSASELAGGLGSLASVAGFSLGGGSESKIEALATLRSRSFLTSFVEDHGIARLLYPKDWDRNTGSWIEEPTINDVIELFSEDVMTIKEDRSTGLVVVQIDWTDARLAAEWANLIVQQANEVMRKRSTDIATASISFLEKELESTSNLGTKQSINGLLEEQIHKIMIANVLVQYAFRVIDPAVPADADDPVFPKPLLMICAGIVLGFLVTICLFFIRGSVSIRY